MNFYKRHIGDYIKDAAHLTLLEHGVYARLMDVYYTREAGIPDGQAARLIGARSKDELQAVQNVLAEFFRLDDGTWVQSRCEREIGAASAKGEQNRENGKKGGRPRKNTTESKSTENPDGFDVGSEKNLSQTPDTRLPDLKPSVPSEVVGTSAPKALADDHIPTTAVEWAKFFDAEHGIQTDTYSVRGREKLWPLAAGWIEAKLSIGRMREAIAKAKDDATEPIMYLPGYVNSVMVNAQTRKREPKPRPLFTLTDVELLAEAQRLGVYTHGFGRDQVISGIESKRKKLAEGATA